MKKIVIFIFLIACCSVNWAQQKVSTVTEVDIQSAVAVTIEELNPGVRIYPYLLEYEMIPKNNPVAVYEEYVTGVSTKSIVANPDYWIKNYVAVAKTQMMKKYNADAILSVTSAATTNEKGQLVVIVRGYPVRYTNFRRATKEDLWILEFEKRDLDIWRYSEENTKRLNLQSSETIIK